MTVGWRQPLIDRSPMWARRLLGPIGSYLDMLLIDHGIFRLAYLNRHRLGDRAWRSAQPAPHDIRAMAGLGVRTIVNLRGERQCGSYWLEQAACKKHGIELVDFMLRSRAAPKREQIRGAVELFDRVAYPVLMHCKSGSDRAGLMSVLYRHLKEGVPARRGQVAALRALRPFPPGPHRRPRLLLRALHRRQQRTPMPFLEWVDKVYDPDEVQRAFRNRGRLGGLAPPRRS